MEINEELAFRIALQHLGYEIVIKSQEIIVNGTSFHPHTSFKITGFGEMSGTTIRQALSSKSTPQQYKQLFTDIFGWYDETIASMLKKKFSTTKVMKESIEFEKSIILEYLVYNLLTEGGAAGHMAHPFDIPTVKTGKDLISVFQKTGDFLTKNKVPVKIDGVKIGRAHV